MADRYVVPQSPPDLHLFGGEWLEHGYIPTAVDIYEPDPCIVCGAPKQTCIGDRNHGEAEE